MKIIVMNIVAIAKYIANLKDFSFSNQQDYLYKVSPTLMVFQTIME